MKKKGEAVDAAKQKVIDNLEYALLRIKARSDIEEKCAQKLCERCKSAVSLIKRTSYLDLNGKIQELLDESERLTHCQAESVFDSALNQILKLIAPNGGR